MTNPIQFELTEEKPGSCQQVLVPVWQDEERDLPWIPKNTKAGFTGTPKETIQVFLPDEGIKVFFLGLGDQGEQVSLHSVFTDFVKKNRQQLSEDLLVDLRHMESSIVYQCTLGISLGEYTVGIHKTKTQTNILQKVRILVAGNTAEVQSKMQEAEHTASTVKEVCTLVDAPANVKTPQYLAHWSQHSAQRYGYQVEILDHVRLEEEGLFALLSVGRGSENHPLLIKAIYRGDADSKSYQLGLVGKGVTFDTGGISIKKSTNMHYMKSDMAGAAAVMGAVELLARLQVPINVVAIIPVAENSVDANSVRPGDVISSYSGKTIEVIDTDAEGRLILADALSYIQSNFQPGTLIDLATLTGSCVAALGYEVAGLFSQDQVLADTISAAGVATGELVWRLPLRKSYGDWMNSDIADIRNLSIKPVAGAITAAKFLEYFVEEGQSWAHLDIAGTAFGDTAFAQSKSATGYGVRLLLDVARTLITGKNK